MQEIPCRDSLRNMTGSYKSWEGILLKWPCRRWTWIWLGIRTSLGLRIITTTQSRKLQSLSIMMIRLTKTSLAGALSGRRRHTKACLEKYTASVHAGIAKVSQLSLRILFISAAINMTVTTAIRSSQISGFGKVLGVSTNDKLSDTLHASDGAEAHSSGTSAHVSFHNAVKTIETAGRKKITARVRARQHQWLDQEYKKAAKRAEKKGRTLPPKEDYFSLWGTNYTRECRSVHLLSRFPNP